ncbi:SGNH/GDSL hydrolase family protein [Pseudactinotalea terrae]|uniref:SGNH/GDSL hydrolase family protein n=1 Tax=Pseudactinotalea terrae TaxID=1743262 RepID=UPI0013907941|nr:SGNH/GDSL hydrolase family protein [Pseudactinotalea terrae]
MTTTIPTTIRSRTSPRPTPLLCALGDSASAGVGDRMSTASRAGVRDLPGCGWPVHLASALGTNMRNLGTNGARARDVLADQLPLAVAARPELATVLIGGNDVLRGDFDILEVSAALASVTSCLLDGGTQVVLVVPPQIGPDLPAPSSVRRVLGSRMAHVRQATREVAAAHARDGLLLVDADPLRAVARDVMHVDRIHPSPRGHRLLAELVADELGGRGWPRVGVVDEVPPAPGVPARVAWMLVRGAPWFVRRSRDLLPELVRVVVSEERQRRRRGRAPA